MAAFKTLIWIINIFSALAIIFLVLMQHGKGADAGAAFGSGSAQGVFGASGSANFLSRSTAISAAIFFITCIMLAFLSTAPKTVINFENIETPTQQTQPTDVPAPVKPHIPE